MKFTQVALITIIVTCLIPQRVKTQTACTECLKAWTETAEKQTCETEARPVIEVKADCSEPLPTSDELKKICKPYWETHSKEGVCCTAASVKKYIDWIDANYGKDKPCVKALTTEVEKSEKNEGAAGKIDELETKIKGAKSAQGGITQADLDKLKEKATKTKGKKKTAAKQKSMAKRAKKSLGSCMFQRFKVDLRALCVSCTRKATEFYDAAKTNIKVKTAVCKKLTQKCGPLFADRVVEVEAVRLARKILKEIKKEAGVKEIPDNTQVSDAGIDLAEKLGDAESPDTLADNADNTKEFCKMVKRGPLNPGVFGDGKTTDVTKAVAADARLLMAINNYTPYKYTTQKRILASTTDTNGYVQDDSAGVDLESSSNFEANLNEDNFQDKEEKYASLVSSLITLALALFTWF